MRLLEETLSHVGHGLLVLSDLLGDTNKHTELWGQVDVLTLLLDFKKRLFHIDDLFVILFFEVDDHGDGGAFLSLFKFAGFRTHIPTNCTDFVGLVMTVLSHHDCPFEFVVNRFLNFCQLWRLSSVALALGLESDHLVIDELQAVFNRQVFRDIVDDQIKSSLEDPRRGEEPWPRLYRIVEGFGLWRHEEARVAANLTQLRISHLCFDDWIYETESKGVLLHFHLIQVSKVKLRNTLDCNCKFTSKICLLGFKINFFVD